MVIFRLLATRTRIRRMAIGMIFLTIILIWFMNCGVTHIHSESTNVCYPPADPTLPHFVIGYGSLMNKKSKQRTDPTAGESIPVRIFEYERTWNAQGKSIKNYSITFLGIEGSKNASFNAVVFQVAQNLTHDSLAAYDNREDWYCRRQVPRTEIQFLDPSIAIDGNLYDTGVYWIYITRPNHAGYPDNGHPIMLSYVDIFLFGCLELETKFNLQGFAQECVNSTTHWGNHFVNNRNTNVMGNNKGETPSVDRSKIDILISGISEIDPHSQISVKGSSSNLHQLPTFTLLFILVVYTSHALFDV